ncbi:hypothetical protein [Sinosporangium siamense]|nr:hypothetical protein [Sinosporangium siamense]
MVNQGSDSGEPLPAETDLSKEDPTERADPQIERERTHYHVKLDLGKDGVSLEADGDTPSWSPAAVAGAVLMLVIASMIVGGGIAAVSLAAAAPWGVTVGVAALGIGTVLAGGVVMIVRSKGRR